MRRPLRTDEDYNEYVKDFYRKVEDYDWNDVSDNFRGLEALLHRSRERHVRNLISRYGRGERYLDIGCGTGLLLRHLPPGSVGIDLNPRHLARARRYAPQARVDLGDAEQLSFPDASFSTIVCTEVIEHLVRPELALAGMHRVLQPGGVVIGSTPRRALLWRLRFLSSTHFHDEPFHNEFERRELLKLFSRFHLTLLDIGFLWSTFFFVLEKRDET